MRTLSVLTLALVWAATFSPLEAQRNNRTQEPPRPQLAAGADTNDARAYYNHGATLLNSKPVRAAAAADAFYWASRIDPSLGEPLYARRIALLVSDHNRLMNYLDGQRRVIESAEMRGIDSLYYRALIREPFLYRRFDRLVLETYVTAWVNRVQGANPSVDRGWLEYQMTSYFRSAGAGMRAWLAYSEQRFPAALDLYATALRSTRDPQEKSAMHLSRARVLVLMGRYAEAQAEISLALQEARKREDRRLVYFYDAKPLLEHSNAIILEALGNGEGAREAYGRALQEDISYYPAHLRLGLLSLSQGDTLGALSAFDLAVQLSQDDPVLRATYGSALLGAQQYSEAAEQLRRAVELEPYFAAPYRLLGSALEALGQPAEALLAYEGYLARASRQDPELRSIRQRVETLRTAANVQPQRDP